MKTLLLNQNQPRRYQGRGVVSGGLHARTVCPAVITIHQ
jgi:hypothetical protein